MGLLEGPIGVIVGIFAFIAKIVIRGIVSLLVMGFAMHVWKKVNKCRGVYRARPFTILYFPLLAILLQILYLVFFITRISFASAGMMILIAPLGILAGIIWGTLIHTYSTRWGRIMIRSRGWHLDFWFAASILAIFFRILPDQWLSTPTMSLMLFASLNLIFIQALLYIKFKYLERLPFKTVAGPPINFLATPDEAALISCLLDLAARQEGEGPITCEQIIQEIKNTDRLQHDLAVGVMPQVKVALAKMVVDASTVAPLLDKLASQPERGLLLPGYCLGEQLKRLLAIGGAGRTITLGNTTFNSSGSAVKHDRYTVLIQAGPSYIMLQEVGDMLNLKEISGAGILDVLQNSYMPSKLPL